MRILQILLLVSSVACTGLIADVLVLSSSFAQLLQLADEA
ncbi:putative membrane protein [Synechococcus sp. MVIR-18-1]|nr:putative membrane protein [Synechococcus sp. MVIR-18-1]